MYKMKHSEYNLEDQDKILKKGCFTGMHIGKAQELLKRQYLKIQKNTVNNPRHCWAV